MTKDEALKLALEALHYCEALNRPVHEQKIHAIKAIKEALDECDEDELIIRYHEMTIKRLEKRIQELTAQPEQEPVARVIDNGTPEGATEWIPFTNRVEPLKTGALLYTTPPQRPWIGLTDEEFHDLQIKHTDDPWANFKAIEAKLKEKNA